MSLKWYDALASTPTVGVWLDRRIISGTSLLDAVSPILSKLGNIHDPAFAINKVESLAVDFTTNDGFNYNLGPEKFVVDFQHRFKVRNYSGSKPVVENLSLVAPYSELLPTVVDRLSKVVDAATFKQPRSISRLGVVCTTRVDEADMPPGLIYIIDYFKKPWLKSPVFYDFQLMAPICVTDKYSDSCIYHFQKPENLEESGSIRLDYQRSFSLPRSIGNLRDSLASLTKEAMDHFISVGQGEQFNG